METERVSEDAYGPHGWLQRPLKVVRVVPDPRHVIVGGQCDICLLATEELSKPCIKRRILFGQNLGRDWKRHNQLQALHFAWVRGNKQKVDRLEVAIQRRPVKG